MIRHDFILAVVCLLLPAPHAAAQDAAAREQVAPAATAAHEPESSTQAAPATKPAAKPAAKPAIYDETADGAAQIAAALARAGKENRRVLIQWGANWCGWCHLLHELCARDKDLARKLLYEYDVVLIDIGRFDKHMELAAKYGADLKGTGVPYLTVLAADGSVLANQETGSLESVAEAAAVAAPAPAPEGPPGDAAAAAPAAKPGHDAAKVLAFLKQHQASYLPAAELYRNALAAAGRDGKRVFLHFGAPWCGWCHKLENWMAQPRVAKLLGRDFIDCKIDVDRTLLGNELLTEHRGGEGGGIPWYQFVAADGSVLADSSAAGIGNIGFPAAPDEIAHFGAMLRKAAVHLTDADIAELLESLAPQPAAPAPGAPAEHAVPATPLVPAVPTSPAAGGR